MNDAEKLALRCEVLDRKIRNIIMGETGLSAGGQATAIAMLVTLEAGIFGECATRLRAQTLTGDHAR